MTATSLHNSIVFENNILFLKLSSQHFDFLDDHCRGGGKGTLAVSVRDIFVIILQFFISMSFAPILEDKYSRNYSKSSK
jgi:hypothetical protein